MINEIEHILSFYIMFKVVAFVTDYLLTFIVTYVLGFLVLDMIGLIKND